MATNEKPPLVFEYQDETPSQRLKRKIKEAPFIVGSLAGLAATAGYGVYKYKNRADMSMSPSVFLLQYRVMAQGTAVGVLTLGVVYNLYNTLTKKQNTSSSAQSNKSN